ncbi:ANTAR domain-containing protein [Amycolatopsis coloradensis]|uniref:ANTAR domain-containing protein n=1 Tax=Amycolatopsis coloradensis TaxID=76021 RepID=A0ACD5BFA0_9PSEU
MVTVVIVLLSVAVLLSFHGGAGRLETTMESPGDEQARETATRIREALGDRVLIAHATGVLMETSHVSAEKAYALLVERSEREDIGLRAVADRLVTDATGSAPS